MKTSINRDARLALSRFIRHALKRVALQAADLCTFELISMGKLNANLIMLGRMIGFQISFKIVQSLRFLLFV